MVFVCVCVCSTGKGSTEIQAHVHSGKPVIHRGRGGQWIPNCWHFGSSTAQLHFWTIPTVLKLVLKEVEGRGSLLTNTWNYTRGRNHRSVNQGSFLLYSLFLFCAYLLVWVCYYFGLKRRFCFNICTSEMHFDYMFMLWMVGPLWRAFYCGFL